MKRRVFFLLCLFLLLYGYTFAQTPSNLVILTDEDSLVVYVPSAGLVSLEGLSFRVDDGSGPKTYALENYSSFRGLPYDSVPTPICFWLVRDTSNKVAPQDCQNKTLLIQRLSAADVFWYDISTNTSRLLIIMQGAIPQAICPSGNPRCNISFTPPTFTPIPPTSTATIPPTLMPTLEATSTIAPIEASEAPPSGVTSNADWAAQAPDIWEFNGIEMVLVPAGCFDMGENAEGGHQCFDEPFWIGQYEVTNDQYRQCVDASVCTLPYDQTYYDDAAYSNHPVVNVTWFQANEYASWLGVRLPTEAEWEYAARGPDDLIYPWGNEFNGNLLNFCDMNCQNSWHNPNFDDGYVLSAPVGTYEGNTSWVGALDMSGNVWEWVSSLYLDYPYDKTHESIGSSDDTRTRVLRGGSWFGDNANWFRTDYRVRDVPNNKSDNWGFRLAKSYESGS